jgi:hypothetical protein
MVEVSRPAAPRRGLWSRASALAAETPASRNRAVDFLRALSILAVISGHWLLASPFITGDGLALGNLLETEPWVQWLSWCFQVMPVFFLVGGYANGVSWQAALRDGKGYGPWLAGRLHRLVGPVLPLVLVWAVLSAVATWLGVAPEIVRVGSQIALVPIWFLAVYIAVVLLAPVTHALWRRLGFYSFWLLVLAAVVDDALFFAADLRAVGWLNYAFVWLAVHQLGYAWHGGQFSGALRTSIFAVGGLALLLALVVWGPYPVSMVSVPGEAVSNSLPPKLTMLILGIAQSGTLLALETPLRRWLERPVAWTATILVNGMIMTVYLWHITAGALVIGLALLAGGVGLDLVPGTGPWWLARPLWMLAYVAALAALVPLVGGFERGRPPAAPVAAWRQVAGALLVCVGLALLALGGVGGEGWLGLRIWALLLPFAGAWLGGLLPSFAAARPA